MARALIAERQSPCWIALGEYDGLPDFGFERGLGLPCLPLA